MSDPLVQDDPENYRRWAQLRVEALNHALEGIPEDRVRYHVCFGSWHVPHVADAPLEAIVELVLKVRAGASSLEAANGRHEHGGRGGEPGAPAGGRRPRVGGARGRGQPPPRGLTPPTHFRKVKEGERSCHRCSVCVHSAPHQALEVGCRLIAQNFGVWSRVSYRRET